MTSTSTPTPERDPLDWRVPQSFTPASSFEVRDRLLGFVSRDLLGPWDGPTERWSSADVPRGPSSPIDRYLVGMLGPRKSQRSDESVDLDLGATTTQEVDLPEVINPRTMGSLWCSSMGVSVQVAATEPTLLVEVDAGRYARYTEIHDEPADEADEADGKGSDHVNRRQDRGRRQARPMAREPLHWSVPVDLAEGDQRIGLEPNGEIAQQAGPEGIVLRVQIRPQHDRLVVRVMLVNDQTPSTPKYAAYLFQTRLSITAPDGHAPIFLPTGEQDAPHHDPEEAHLDLLYRHAPSFAAGHNVAALVDRDDPPAEDSPTTELPRAWRVRTEWLPVCDLPRVAAPSVSGLETSMTALAELADAANHDDPSVLTERLTPLVKAYEHWLKQRTAEAAALDPVWQPTTSRALTAAQRVLARLNAAIGVLRDNAQARSAFAFANRAMALQRHNTEAAALRERDPQLTYADAIAQVTATPEAARTAASWRAFQLAFVLLNLPALTTPDATERTEDVDLLFFPTGGGKTEAYLGLAAYTFAIRRLQGIVGAGTEARDGGAGVAVLMRYTLRLLTAQQFQRAAALVCACEVLRRQDPSTWGTERFSVGLWVGMTVSPNTYDDAETQIGQARESGRRGAKVPVLQTSVCPWCGEELLAERDLHPSPITRTITLSCPRGDGEEPCPFSRRVEERGLPILTVDEQVYHELPSLLIATVDKLAQLPWHGYAGMLFGRVSERCPRHGYRHPDLDARTGCGSRHSAQGRSPAVSSVLVVRLRPPDLIIQDELHLISGALGSTVGLFESAVDELTSWVTPSGRRTSPKIIASTATTKRAAEQVRALFARDLTIFPPQVLDARDTFFSVEQPITPTDPGRRYLGICAHGTRLKAAEIRLSEILLLAGQTCLDTYGEAADPYTTVVGYFNSIRELAGMRRYLDDQVLLRVTRTPWRKGLTARAGRPLHVIELTSRITAAYITDALRRLAVPFNPETRTYARQAAIRDAIKARHGQRPDDLDNDWPTDVVLATSMLQVGVDITRLGLMVITGQPKNVAEYIQASSRVGRTQDKPGLVITLFNWTRPRDLAHFEGFQHAHATMYRRVEALSVTPFARRCLDRGTAATTIAALRNSDESWSVNTAAEDVPLAGDAAQAVIQRMAERAERAAGEQARSYLLEKVHALTDRWRDKQDRAAAPVAYRRTRRKGTQYTGLLHRAGDGGWDELTVAQSMRETENEISLLLPASPRIFDPVIGATPWATYTPPDDRDDEPGGEDA